MAVRAPSYTFEQLLAVVGRKASRGLQDDLGTIIVNNTISWIHDKYDFRWTTAPLPPFYLVPNAQDYGAPAVIIPSDFYGLRWAELIRTDNEPPYRYPLTIIKDLLPTHARYIPHAICYVPDSQVFRIFPRFIDNCGSPTYLITGVYKKVPPKILTENLATTFLPSDDVYFPLWIEVAKYIMWQIDSDPRAGSVTVANGQVSMTGQAAIAHDMIEWCASREGLELGDPAISPAEPLVAGIGSTAGMLGLGFAW